MPFPLSDAIGDAVETQLQGDATTKTVSWTRGEMNWDDPTQVPVTDAYGDMVPFGFIVVHELRLQPKLMGGAPKTAWISNAPVQVTLVAKSQEKDVQAARRQAEDMLTNVLRVLAGGDVTLGGLVMHIDEMTATTDGIPLEGIAWATVVINYRFLASPT